MSDCTKLLAAGNSFATLLRIDSEPSEFKKTLAFALFGAVIIILIIIVISVVSGRL